MQNILSNFLNAGLLQIGEDDEKLKLLEGAAGELSKRIAASPLLAYRFTLVALDSRSKASDPVLVTAEEAIRNKWNTINNKIGAGAVQVYRAVILRAVEIAASANPRLKTAMTLIAANEPALFTYGKEREAIDIMLGEFGTSTIAESTQTWVNPVELILPKLAAKPKKPPATKEELVVNLSRSVGPLDLNQKPQQNANPVWPDSGQSWANEFVGRAADAFIGAIQSNTNGVIDGLQESLRQGFEALANGVKNLAIRDAKSELLWIRTSMYSPSARRSYRELSPVDLLLHVVLDATLAVTPDAPQSVEYFIRELVGTLDQSKLVLIQVLQEIGPHLTDRPENQPLFKDELAATGRRSWLDLAIRPCQPGEFSDQSGVALTHESSSAELAVIFYRELQVRRLLTSKS